MSKGFSETSQFKNIDSESIFLVHIGSFKWPETLPKIKNKTVALDVA